MRIHVHNPQREPLFSADVDPASPPSVVRSADGEQEAILQWEQTLDDQGHLRRCPICGCRELFVRKDFPQVTGFVLVVFTVVVSMFLLGFQRIIEAIILLGAMVVLDFVIYQFTGKCLVCYRCRSEFRQLPIPKSHPGWDLAIGEKYRILPEQAAIEPAEQDTQQQK